VKEKEESGSKAWVLRKKTRKVKAAKRWEMENGAIIEVGMS